MDEIKIIKIIKTKINQTKIKIIFIILDKSQFTKINTKSKIKTVKFIQFTGKSRYNFEICHVGWNNELKNCISTQSSDILRRPKFWINLPLKLSNLKKWKIDSNFVAFSQYLNFDSTALTLVMVRLSISYFPLYPKCRHNQISIGWANKLLVWVSTGRPVVPLSRDKKKFLSWCPFVPGQGREQMSWDKLLCPGTSKYKMH